MTPDIIKQVKEALDVATTPLPEDRQKIREALALLGQLPPPTPPEHEIEGHECPHCMYNKLRIECIKHGVPTHILRKPEPPPMTEAKREKLVEEMAEALYEKEWEKIDAVPWEEVKGNNKRYWVDSARAALAVIERRKGE